MRMNGLYPGPATAPGWNFASGNPSGPGSAIRVGLKSGAPWKLTTAWPNRFCVGGGRVERHGLDAVRAADAEVGQLGREVDAEVVRHALVGGVEQDVPDRLAVGPALVQREAYRLLAEVDVDRALLGQMIARQQPAELAEPLRRGQLRLRARLRVGRRQAPHRHRRSDDCDGNSGQHASLREHLHVRPFFRSADAD